MKIEWKIRTKLWVFGFYCAAMMTSIGTLSYWAMTDIDFEMSKISKNAKAIRDHMEADMMHDAIRADVLNAFLQGLKADSRGKKTVLDDLSKHEQQLREAISGVSRNLKNTEIEEALDETYPALDAYVQNANQVVQLAFENSASAATRFDAFIVQFGLLEKKMEHLSNLIEKEAEDSQTIGKKLVSSSKYRIFSLTVVTLLILGVIVFAISSPIIRRLGELTQAAERVARGDLTVRSDATRMDEIGCLSKAFNRMTQNLYALVSQLQDSSTRISSSAEDLSTSSRIMSVHTEKTESQAKKVASVSQATHLSIQTVSSASEEMSSSIAEISKSVQEATLITSEAVKMAESTNRIIAKLGDSSKEIGNVIKVITSIAQQTNLLALNASIEAARAGEAGKGFAVVANEVKDLAKATAKATEEIGQKIMAIQQDSQEAVSVIGDIGDVITKINNISTSIAGAVEEQTMTTNDISRNVAEVSRGTREVSKSIADVETASRTMAEGAISVMAASQTLTAMGVELLALVNRFQVSRDDALAVSLRGTLESTKNPEAKFTALQDA